MRMCHEEITKIMQEAGYELLRADLDLLEYQYLLEFGRSYELRRVTRIIEASTEGETSAWVRK